MDSSAPHFRHPGLTVIGLTGGIGTGKSTSAGMLSDMLGCLLIDADVEARRLLESEQPGWHALRTAFGNRFSGDGQQVDRRLLRRELFRDGALRQQVNQLLHPLVKQAIAKRIEAALPLVPPLVLVEVPLLFEAGWEGEFDSIILVTASEEACLARLMVRDGVTKSEALAAMGAQWPLAEKGRRAHHVIENSADPETTRQQLRHLAQELADTAASAAQKKS